MSDNMSAILLVIFLTHLVAFSLLGVRRRQWYYLALVITFALLSASFALRLFAVEVLIAGVAWFQWTRWLAWVSAAISITWTVARYTQRRKFDGHG